MPKVFKIICENHTLLRHFYTILHLCRFSDCVFGLWCLGQPKNGPVREMKSFFETRRPSNVAQKHVRLVVTECELPYNLRHQMFLFRVVVTVNKHPTSNIRFCFCSAYEWDKGRPHLYGQKPRLCSYLQGNPERRHRLRVQAGLPSHQEQPWLQVWVDLSLPCKRHSADWAAHWHWLPSGIETLIVVTVAAVQVWTLHTFAKSSRTHGCYVTRGQHAGV